MAGPPVLGLVTFSSSYVKTIIVTYLFLPLLSLTVNDDDGYEPPYCIPDFKVRHSTRNATFSSRVPPSVLVWRSGMSSHEQ